MSLAVLSLAAASQLLIPSPPCEDEALLQARAVEVVRLARNDQRAEFDGLVSSEVSMDVGIGDQIFSVRDDERAATVLGDARQQVMSQLRSWSLNRYTVRSSGPICAVSESIGLEFSSDTRNLSLFLTFVFDDGQLIRLEGQGYLASEFEIGGTVDG